MGHKIESQLQRSKNFMMTLLVSGIFVVVLRQCKIMEISIATLENCFMVLNECIVGMNLVLKM